MITQPSKILQKVNNIEANKLQQESFTYFGRTFLVASWTAEVKGFKGWAMYKPNRERERKFVKNVKKETRERKERERFMKMEANYMRSWLPLVMVGQFLSVATLVKNSSGQQITTILAVFFIELSFVIGTMVLLKAEWFPLRSTFDTTTMTFFSLI